MQLPINSMKAAATIAAASALFMAAPALAQTSVPAGASAGHGWGQGQHQMNRAPGVFGTVSAISGDTLTVSSKFPAQKGATSSAETTYTVNAGSATVTKNGAASSLSSIAVGDSVMVQGTVSGTSVAATKIEDGMPAGMKPGMGFASSTKMRAPLPQLQGNGEPIVGGTASSISGDTISLSTKAGTSYSVDATNATVFKGNATSSLSAVASGDNLVVQGAVNGSAVAASSIIDQGAPKSSGSGASMPGPIGGFIGAIGGFFRSFFGFF